MWYGDWVDERSPEIEAKFLRHQLKDLEQLRAGVAQDGPQFLDDQIEVLTAELERALKKR